MIGITAICKYQTEEQNRIIQIDGPTQRIESQLDDLFIFHPLPEKATRKRPTNTISVVPMKNRCGVENKKSFEPDDGMCWP